MPKCPACEKEIDKLYYDLVETDSGKMYSGCESKSYGGDVKEFHGYCPECDEELFTSWRVAQDFLDGEVSDDG